MSRVECGARGALAVIVALGLSSAKSETPCFVFLLRGDAVLNCGRRAQVTHCGDLRGLAVSGPEASVAYLTSKVVKRTSVAEEVRITATIVNLVSHASNVRGGVTSLISTCGGILPLLPADMLRKPEDVVTGAVLDYAPYQLFRCSADRKVIIGKLKSRELWEGKPPRQRIAAAGDVDNYQFNISPAGSQIVYLNERLCVYSSSGRKTCIETHGKTTGLPSIADSGEVLVSTGTDATCFYKDSYNFSSERFAGATDASKDECLGIGYWKPGTDSIKILEPLGRDPQWIGMETGELLRRWSEARARPSISPTMLPAR